MTIYCVSNEKLSLLLNIQMLSDLTDFNRDDARKDIDENCKKIWVARHFGILKLNLEINKKIS